MGSPPSIASGTMNCKWNSNRKIRNDGESIRGILVSGGIEQDMLWALCYVNKFFREIVAVNSWNSEILALIALENGITFTVHVTREKLNPYKLLFPFDKNNWRYFWKHTFLLTNTQWTVLWFGKNRTGSFQIGYLWGLWNNFPRNNSFRYLQLDSL